MFLFLVLYDFIPTTNEPKTSHYRSIYTQCPTNISPPMLDRYCSADNAFRRPSQVSLMATDRIDTLFPSASPPAGQLLYRPFPSPLFAVLSDQLSPMILFLMIMWVGISCLFAHISIDCLDVFLQDNVYALARHQTHYACLTLQFQCLNNNNLQHGRQLVRTVYG